MKRVLQYFIWFGLLYLLVEIFSFATLVSTYVSKPVDVSNIPAGMVEITESKFTGTNGYIKGKITNNTDEPFVNKYLKVELYSKRDNILGRKYLKLNDLQPGESQEFDMRFNTDMVDHVKMYLIGEEEFNTDNPTSKELTFDILKLNNTNPWLWFAAFTMVVSFM